MGSEYKGFVIIVRYRQLLDLFKNHWKVHIGARRLKVYCSGCMNISFMLCKHIKGLETMLGLACSLRRKMALRDREHSESCMQQKA